MAPSSSIKFIDTALSSTSPFVLSYTNPDQKWLIRKHLLSFLEDYPDFRLSTDTFNHNDGTMVNLLNMIGYLHVSNSNSTPPIPLTIWVHENYPYMPPIVFVNSSNTMTPIHKNHPFVDNSGATIPPYLQTWKYPRCNLLDLMRKLVKIFAHDHPFAYSGNPSLSHPSFVSKIEALDRLTGMLHYDMVALQAKAEEDIEELSKLQAEMIKRVGVTKTMAAELEHERRSLKEKVMELKEDADVLMNWLRVHDPKSVGDVMREEIEDAFLAVDEESKVLLDNLAADRAIEDLLYALDKAIEQGVVSFDSYIRQVRILAREQFFHRANQVKLKRP